METDEADLVYRVVVNHEEQYSIWPADRELPPGWREEGTSGTKDDCLAHIDQVWTDMRPLSLRRFMQEQAQRGHDTDVEQADSPEQEQETLVSRLSRGTHPVEVSIRPERTAAALREAIERGHVYVRFTETGGGTELGISLDPAATDVSGADFDTGTGTVTLVGDLTLDFEPVRCRAEVDLASFTGQGGLAIRQPEAG